MVQEGMTIIVKSEIAIMEHPSNVISDCTWKLMLQVGILLRFGNEENGLHCWPPWLYVQTVVM
jgi:hypothetical protein